MPWGLRPREIVSLIIAFGLTLGISFSSYAVSDDLSEMSLEDLLNIEVTSVSKKAEKQKDAAAAIYVITSEDIRRSGVTSIPDALRMVPGLSVAQIDTNKWSIASRGFAGKFSTKLLVLIDGRSVYTPLFSGVYWEEHDVMLEDVDRIEVIRGPGGALWGANAVNGIINIITKSADETQGGLFTIGGGFEEQAFTSFRYGNELGDQGHYRIYGKMFQRDGGGTPPGVPVRDLWQMGQGGFRLDWSVNEQDTLMILGDFHYSDANTTYLLPTISTIGGEPTNASNLYEGGNLLARWNRTLSEESDFQLQVYFDRYQHEFPTLQLREFRNNYDIDFQHRFRFLEAHDMVWGVEFRRTEDHLDGGEFISFTPTERKDDVTSGFFQDQFALTDTTVLTLGTKVEHNDYTGWEIQPNIRLRWKPSDTKTVWVSFARAVRTPARAQDDIRLVLETIPDPSMTFPTARTVFFGDRSFDSEYLYAFELGYRAEVNEKVSFDAATFFNIYTDLQSNTVGTPTVAGPILHLEIPITAGNESDAQTYGFEVVVDYQAKPWWQLRGSYTFFEMIEFTEPHSLVGEGGVPENQAYIRSRMDLPRDVELDMVFRYTDSLPELFVSSYVEFDARIAWTPRENLELSVIGRNLLNEHFEYLETIVPSIPTRAQRAVFAKVTWTF